MSPLELSIIIVSRNAAQHVARALTSLMAETHETSYEVIVADRGSSDNPEAVIREHAAAASLVRFSSGTTVARATTEAARLAKGKYILLLHADTVVTDGAVDKIVAFAKANRSARIWGGRTLFHDGRLDPRSCWQRMSAWNLICRAMGLTGLFKDSAYFNAEAYGGWKRDCVREVDIITDSFFLIERELWAGLRGFDPVFNECGQEADLCLRARAFSARPLFTPTASVVHHGKIERIFAPDYTVAMLEAKAILITRHWPNGTAALGLYLLCAWPLSRALISIVLAKVTRSRTQQLLGRHWRDVWRRRAQWNTGAVRPVAATSTVAPPLAATAT